MLLPDPAMFVYFAIAAAMGRHLGNHPRFLPAFIATTITVWSAPALVEWVWFHTTSPLIMLGLLEFMRAYLVLRCAEAPTWWNVCRAGLFTAFYLELRRTVQVAVIQPFLIAALPSTIRFWFPQKVHWYTATFVAFRIVWPTYALTQLTATATVFSVGMLLIALQCGVFAWRLIFEPPLIE